MPYARRNAVSDFSCDASPENLEEPMRHLKIGNGKDSQEGAKGGMNLYPERPGEPDCSFYTRTGLCNYGNKCKYNHPPVTVQEVPLTEGTHFKDELPQRDGQPDCQFFLKTGTCKFGKNCKYHHPRDKQDSQLLQFNILGLPMRKDEKSCPYYMRTRSCKFGVTCKFNHPQPVNTTAYAGFSAPTPVPYSVGLPLCFSRPPFMLSPGLDGLQYYIPLILPPTQLTMPMQQGWSTYLPGPSVSVDFPERPDQPKCQFYMKTGSCKFGSSCKYHHPKEMNQVSPCFMGPFGLPHRPDAPACTSYATYGICKYGEACKFDHPFAAVPPLQEPALISAYHRRTKFTWMATDDLCHEVPKSPDEFKKSVIITEIEDGPSTETTFPSHTAAPQSD
ncbi:zinc finger CCCH domain-containing protein 3-like isoform X3 [Curcuma longa]|uniref:zinc finger CCCH domain-containing protein 3-like isoform X3 n=1 Tax=Curcuma longa TaxID=136217 RepID=UPI003D9F745B